MSDLTEEAQRSFVDNSTKRTVEIIHDNGLHRHLKCRNGDTWCMGFCITTWPGYLAISGDMGCYVFARIEDMFEFFRGGCNGGINEGYWAEKVQAADKVDGLREFDEDDAREWVAKRVKEYREHHGDKDGEEIDTDGINYDDGMIRFFDSLPSHDAFADAWEDSHKRYTFRYLWCCFAIVWAIKEYDRIKDQAAAPVGSKS